MTKEQILAFIKAKGETDTCWTEDDLIHGDVRTFDDIGYLVRQKSHHMDWSWWSSFVTEGDVLDFIAEECYCADWATDSVFELFDDREPVKHDFNLKARLVPWKG